VRQPNIAVVARKLALHSSLSEEARQSLGPLLGHPRQFAAGAMIALAGDPADLVSFVEEGVVCRMALLRDGSRQIQHIFLAGDAADVEASLLLRRTDNVQAITRCSVWLVPKSRLAALPRTVGGLAEAFLREATVNAETAREWIVNLGRRSADQRIAHLICELCTRMDGMEVGSHGLYPFPFTQRDIADAQGLSVVHVNRVLKHLKALGLIEARRKMVRILDRPGLEALGLFQSGYLHIQGAAAA
jgi:CRP-like cAMP-binding protein